MCPAALWCANKCWAFRTAPATGIRHPGVFEVGRAAAGLEACFVALHSAGRQNVPPAVLSHESSQVLMAQRAGAAGPAKLARNAHVATRSEALRLGQGHPD